MKESQLSAATCLASYCAAFYLTVLILCLPALLQKVLCSFVMWHYFNCTYNTSLSMQLLLVVFMYSHVSACTAAFFPVISSHSHISIQSHQMWGKGLIEFWQIPHSMRAKSWCDELEQSAYLSNLRAAYRDVRFFKLTLCVLDQLTHSDRSLLFDLYLGFCFVLIHIQVLDTVQYMHTWISQTASDETVCNAPFPHTLVMQSLSCNVNASNDAFLHNDLYIFVY